MRAAIQFPLWDQVFATSQTRMEYYMAWVRDLFRSKLDSGATGNDYAVSDIFKWAGWANEFYPYAFLIEERDGAGVATGNQWMIVIPHYMTGVPYVSSSFQSYATYMNRFGSSDTSDQVYPFIVWFFPEGGLRRSKITLNGGHTFVGGDVGSEIQIVSTGAKTGTILSLSGNEMIVEHKKGAKWAAADAVEVTGTPANAGTIATEDWRTFPNVGWTDFSTLSLAADFSAPDASPYTAIADFLPKEGTGAPHRNYKGRYADGKYQDIYPIAQFVFDNDAGFCAAYCSSGAHYGLVRDIFVSGTIMENSDGSTTYQKGAAGWRITSDSSQGPYSDAQYHEAEYYGGGAGTAGNHATFSERSHEHFNIWNCVLPTSPQTYAESRVYLYNTNESKGWINPDIVRIQGAANNYQGLMTSRGGAGQNLCLKMTDQLMFPWVANAVFGHPKYELITEWPPLHLWV